MAKTLTELQKKNKYNRISKMTYLLQYLSMCTPYIAIGIAKWDEYFVQYNGTKVSIAFIMAMVVLGLTVYGTTKDKFKDTTWSLMIKLIVFSFIFYLLGSLISDLALICLCGSFGLMGSGIFNKVSESYANKRDRIINAINKAKDKALDQKVEKELAESGQNDIGSIL